MSKKQNIMIGATVTAGLAGILTSLLLSKKSSNSFSDGLTSLSRKNDNNDDFLLGGLAGGVAGMILSFLFAPQSGQDLVKSISRHLHQVEKRSVKKKSHSSSVAKRVKNKAVKSVEDAVKSKRKQAKKSTVKKPRAPKKTTARKEKVQKAEANEATSESAE